MRNRDGTGVGAALIVGCLILDIHSAAADERVRVMRPRVSPHPHVEQTLKVHKLKIPYQQRLVLGLSVDLAPGVVLGADGPRRGNILGFTGHVAVNAAGEFVSLRGEYESYEDDRAEHQRWFAGLTVGDGLKRPAKRAITGALGQVKRAGMMVIRPVAARILAPIGRHLVPL